MIQARACKTINKSRIKYASCKLFMLGSLDVHSGQPFCYRHWCKRVHIYGTKLGITTNKSISEALCTNEYPKLTANFHLRCKRRSFCTRVHFV